MGLSNYQLVLLDNLVYLDEVARATDKGTTIGKVVNNLLYKDGNSANGVGSGTIKTDWTNHYQDGESANCMTTEEEWIQILQAIEKDKTLCSMKIHTVENDDANGFRAMALTSETTGENAVIFRGTTAAYEWMDNAEGGYSKCTTNQKRALDFVNGLDFVDNNSVVVSGHSKGGNLAQFVALYATNVPVDRCLSLDGQGFSEEAYVSEEYKEAIKRRGQNLYMISSSGDYVNVLFNSPVPEEHKMYLAANPQGVAIQKYHKPNNIFLIEDGEIKGLNEPKSISLGSYFLQELIEYVTKTEKDVEKKKILYDGLMGIMAANAESGDDMETFPKMDVQGIVDIGISVLMKKMAMWSGLVNGVLGKDVLDVYQYVMDGLSSDQYKGELYQAYESGALDLLVGYLSKFIDESPRNCYLFAALVDDTIGGIAFAGWKQPFKMEIRSIWGSMMDACNIASDYNIGKIWAEIAATKAETNTLGEDTKGNVYTERLEDGGMLYIGSGESENGINGTIGNDIIYGGNGADTINGGAGNDVLWGGRGNDILNGGSGADRYVFGLYDGDDTIINDNSGNYKDYIFFDEDVKASDVSFEMSGLNLVIHVGTASSVTVNNFFAQSGDGRYLNAIDTIEFMNGGSKLGFAEICRRAGYEGADSTQKKGEGSGLSEGEKDALEKEERELKKWYNEHEEKRRKEDSDANGTGASTGSNSSGGVTGSGSTGTGSSGSAGTEGGSAGNTNVNEDNNAQNSVNRAKDKVMDWDDDWFDDSERVPQLDPIIVDLNGDGIFTTSLEDGVYFDLNKDGFAEKTAWISTEDGLLVRDVNGNGKIDDGGELFGDRTILSDGSTATSGFQALSDLDDNKDDILDEKDQRYHELKIWMDTNHNGISEVGEQYSLEHFGITSIDLKSNQINRTDENGNLMKAGSNIYGQDVNYSIGEYDFNVNLWDTKYRGEEIDTSILEEYLPEIGGCGTLLDLSKAMALNDDLKAMVSLYITEPDYRDKREILQNVLFLWADVAEVEAGSRGPFIDARKLGVLEKAYGRSFMGISGPNPNNRAAEMLGRLYVKFEQEVEECLLSQTAYREALSAIQVYHNADTQGSYCDFTSAIKTLVESQSICYIPLFVDYVLKNTNLGDLFDKQYIYEQLKCENEVWAQALNTESVVYRTNSEIVKGSNQNDILLSGTESDILMGGKGDDIYIFEKGAGQDTITETSGTDTILFGEGIGEEDIRVSRDNQNLYLTNKRSGDRITVQDFFANQSRQIEKVAFADGSSWDMEAIKDRARYYYGGEGDDRLYGWDSLDGTLALEDDYMYGGAGNDTINGANGDDVLYGEEGNDTLIGGNGNDLLSGGSGNDTLNGGAGDDTYLFQMGAGQDIIAETSGTDTILFGEGIQEEDIRISRDSKNLYLTNQKSGDRITVQDFFANQSRQIEKVAFADGSSWDMEAIKHRARYYYGGEGDDRLYGWNSSNGVPALEDDYMYGGAGNDTINGANGDDTLYGEAGNDSLLGGNGNDLLDGGSGNDTLYGGADDDTYIFNIGDGQDTITEESGTDTILFGEGIGEGDILVSRDNKNLYLTNKRSGDRITVQDFFSYENRQIEKVVFADGSSWDMEAIKDRARYYYGGEGDDRLYGWSSSNGVPALEDDYMYGGAGNDTINGADGDDALYGEAGNDSLLGGNGNDLLDGGSGDDTLNGGAGDDTYIFNIGDGQDTITETSGTDTVLFGKGIDEGDILVSRDNKNLYLTNKRSGDRITVQDFFSYESRQIEKVVFADGSSWDMEAIKDRARYYYGGEGDDRLYGWSSSNGVSALEDDYMYGGAGNDTINGADGDDALYGEAGNDSLLGGNGNDLLDGGNGDDTLNGGAGDDTYIFNIGDGRDTITETSGTDTVLFGEGIHTSDVMFSKTGNNLKISFVGKEDNITISNYFYHDNYKVESFRTSDGSTLDYTKLNVMIQAMASFEDTSGMMWEDAVEQKNEQANDLINQWWTKEAI